MIETYQYLAKHHVDTTVIAAPAGSLVLAAHLGYDALLDHHKDRAG